MKFLIFSNEFPPMRTGVSSYNEIIANGLVQRGHEVTVLTFRPQRALPQQTLAQEVRIPLGNQKWLEVARIAMGISAYRRLAPRFDANLLSSDLAQKIAGDFRLGSVARSVCAVHGSEVTKRFPARSWANRVGWRLRLGTLRHAGRLVSNSQYTRNLMISAGLDQCEIDVVYAGVPDASFDAEPDPKAIRELKQRLTIGEAELVLLTLARVVERKGHDRVLAAFERVLREYRAVRYVIAGTGDDLERIRTLAEKMHLGDRVIFTGEIGEEEKQTYYDMCDIFVMPSLHDGRRVEGLGLSFIEAGARRKPSIGGDHGGVPEVIDHEKTGYLVDPDDIETLAKRITTLAADAGLRRQFGEGAYRQTNGRFRETIMVGGIERLLIEVGSR
jgi:glycosyltransferase involved in cell wall biosynthesis